MEKKLVLLVLVVLVCFSLGIALVFLINSANPLDLLSRRQVTDTTDQSGTKVVSWQPDTATLAYKLGRETKSISIQPLKPVVIVPIYDNGKFIREELTLVPQATYWKSAFCPGDTLELEQSAAGEIITIRNKGPRQCPN